VKKYEKKADGTVELVVQETVTRVLPFESVAKAVESEQQVVDSLDRQIAELQALRAEAVASLSELNKL